MIARVRSPVHSVQVGSRLWLVKILILPSHWQSFLVEVGNSRKLRSNLDIISIWFHPTWTLLALVSPNLDIISIGFIQPGHYSSWLINCYQLSWSRKSATVKSFKAGVSSVSHSLWRRSNARSVADLRDLPVDNN